MAALAAGGVFLISPYNHIVPIHTARLPSAARQVAASGGFPPEVPLAPAATLATAPLPATGPPPVRKPVVADSKETQIREFQSYRPSDQAQPGAPVKPVPAAPAPSGSPAPPHPGSASSTLPSVHEVGISPSTPPSASAVPAGNHPLSEGSAQTTPVAPAAPPSKESAASPGPVAAGLPGSLAIGPTAPSVAPSQPPAPHAVGAQALASASAPAKPDPVAVATELRPGPMTETQEIQVLSLVTQLGAIIRDQRTEIASLRADQEKTSSTVQVRLNDFDRRLLLAEARGAIGAAMGAATTVSATATTSIAPPAGKSPVELTTAATVAPPDSRPHRYRVQAASPGLAMLAEIDRSGGEGAQLQVAIGDTVPGYGKVTDIAQHGTAWVVQTEHSAIQ